MNHKLIKSNDNNIELIILLNMHKFTRFLLHIDTLFIHFFYLLYSNHN